MGNLLDISFYRYSRNKMFQLTSRLNIWNEKVDHRPFSFSIEPNVGYRTERAILRHGTAGLQGIVGKDFFDEALYIALVPGIQWQTNVSDPTVSEKHTAGVGGLIGYRINRITVALGYYRPFWGYRYTPDGLTTRDLVEFSLTYRIYKHGFSIVIGNHPFESPSAYIAGGAEHPFARSNFRFGFNITREVDFVF